MEKPAASRTSEEQMLDMISMSLYGRPMQNRCSILNRGQRQQLETVVREMASSDSLQQEKTAEQCN